MHTEKSDFPDVLPFFRSKWGKEDGQSAIISDKTKSPTEKGLMVSHKSLKFLVGMKGFEPSTP